MRLVLFGLSGCFSRFSAALQPPLAVDSRPLKASFHFSPALRRAVFNGRDGRHLATFDNPPPHQGSTFGYTVASPGDVNGDQIPDFAIGAAGQSSKDKVAVGGVYVFLSSS